MNVGVLDLETSKKPILHPWMKGAYLSTIGLDMFLDDGTSYYKEWVWYHSERPDITQEDRLQIIFEIQDEMDKLKHGGILAGHNVKFDINWLKHFNVDFDHVQLWCTAISDFMLRGHSSELRYNLSSCCERWHIPVKTDAVKTYWDAGVDTADIKLSLVLPYQRKDVDITGRLFKAQFKKMQAKQNLLDLCKIRCNTLHSITEIETIGMPFDREAAEYWVDHFQKDLEVTNAELRSYMGRDDINLGSGPDLSAGLFGGTLKRTEYVPLVYTRNCTVKEPYKFTYKAGKRKGQTVTKYKSRTVLELTCKRSKHDYEVEIPGIGFVPPERSETAVAGVHKTNKGILANLKANGKGGTTAHTKRRALELLLHRKKIAKFTSTFVGSKEGTGLFFKADNNMDGWLHPSYNQTIAVTGRLTSSDPNGQNFPRSKEDEDGFTNPLKSCFIPSREGGLILVIDLSQLEWRVAAWQAQDQVAMQEIFDGVDIHLDNAVRFFGDAKYRQAAKIMTFRLLYGGGAYAFYMDPLMPDFSLKKWTGIVDQYKRKYFGITAWQNRNISSVGQNKGWLFSPTGRMYKFPREESKKHPGVMLYDEKKIKNYPVQGTATGDIVPLAMNDMQDKIIETPQNFQSTNWMGTVHDSLLFDTMPHEVKRVAMTGIQVFENLPARLKDIWDLDFNLPLTGEAEWGPNYGNMTHSVKHKGGEWIMSQE